MTVPLHVAASFLERLPGLACNKAGGKNHADVKSLEDISTPIS